MKICCGKLKPNQVINFELLSLNWFLCMSLEKAMLIGNQSTFYNQLKISLSKMFLKYQKLDNNLDTSPKDLEHRHKQCLEAQRIYNWLSMKQCNPCFFFCCPAAICWSFLGRPQKQSMFNGCIHLLNGSDQRWNGPFLSYALRGIPGKMRTTLLSTWKRTVFLFITQH